MRQSNLNCKNTSTTKWISSKTWLKNSQEMSTGSKPMPFSNRLVMLIEVFFKEFTKSQDSISTLASVSTTTWPASVISENCFRLTTIRAILLKKVAQGSSKKYRTTSMWPTQPVVTIPTCSELSNLIIFQVEMLQLVHRPLLLVQDLATSILKIVFTFCLQVWR